MLDHSNPTKESHTLQRFVKSLPGDEREKPKNNTLFFLPDLRIPDLVKIVKNLVYPKKVIAREIISTDKKTTYTFFSDKKTFNFYDKEVSRRALLISNGDNSIKPLGPQQKDNADAFLFVPNDEAEKRIHGFLQDKLQVTKDGITSSYESALDFFRKKESDNEGKIYEDMYSVLRDSLFSFKKKKNGEADKVVVIDNVILKNGEEVGRLL